MATPLPIPFQLPPHLKHSKLVAVYYTYMDINNTPQTGNTTFSVEATGTTQSDIEKNLHSTISDTLANIEETIVYDIVNRIVVNINKSYPFSVYPLMVEKHDSSIVIGYPDATNTYYDWYTINFPIQFPIQFPTFHNQTVILKSFWSLPAFPKISKILIY